MLTILRDVMDELVPVRRGNVPRSAALRTLTPDRGVGPEWQAAAYGEYYARSADVYSAVNASSCPSTARERSSPCSCFAPV